MLPLVSKPPLTAHYEQQFSFISKGQDSETGKAGENPHQRRLLGGLFA